MIRYFWNTLGSVYVIMYAMGWFIDLDCLTFSSVDPLWRSLTYQFTHTSIIHLVVNLFGLHTACKVLNELDDDISVVAVLYFSSVIVAGIFHTAWSDLILSGSSTGVLFLLAYAVIRNPKYNLDGLPVYIPFAIVLSGIFINTIFFSSSNNGWIPHTVSLLYGVLMGWFMGFIIKHIRYGKR